MEMTNEEICRHYTQAADRRKDISILADLNGTNTAAICAVLKKGGVLEEKPKKAKAPSDTSVPAHEEAISAEIWIDCMAKLVKLIPCDANNEIKERTINLCTALLKEYITEQWSRGDTP